MKVIIFFSFVDRTTETVRLIGRVQTLNNINSTGVTGIEIFKGRLKDQKLVERIQIGETTDGKEYITNDGFFDVTTKIEAKESLFFLRPNYYVEEFKIFKLFND